jgi:hypothetical protein
MKQKLFENVGGNSFKLITESVEEADPKVKLVREGLKKVFGAGHKEISYKRLQGVGLGYIKSVADAQKTAIQEARIIAKECGYTDDENTQKFVKEDGEVSDFDRGEFENGHRPPVSTPGKGSHGGIGQQILAIVDSPGMDQAMETEKSQLRQLAQELIAKGI